MNQLRIPPPAQEQQQVNTEQQQQYHYHQHQHQNTPISSSDDLDEEEDDDEDDEDEDGADPLDAPDFPSKFLQTTHRKPVNIYETDIDLSEQARHHQTQNQTHQFQNQSQFQFQQQQQPINSAQPTLDQQKPASTTTRPTNNNRSHSITPPGIQPDQQQPFAAYTNNEITREFHRHHQPASPPQSQNINSNQNRLYPADHQQQSQQSVAGLSASGGEVNSRGNPHRPHSRASVQVPSRATKPAPPPQQQQPTGPTTNRSRMGPSDESINHHTRPRRLSDGSVNGGVRKDILLQRMAEALQSERAKAIVFQRELQNAEREIDDLANTLDDQRREHHKIIVHLKKDIKLLKKERESLVDALEAAEGVEQEEAERYLALLDPAAQAVMATEEDIEEQQSLKKVVHNPQPILDEYDLSNYKSTIRAQMQERSALRAQRINSELLKINPGGSIEPNETEKPTDNNNGINNNRQGRPRETPNRIRRKLSKSRPSSRDGSSGGLFWRRSGSRNRGENNDEKSSSAPGTMSHKHHPQSNNNERRKTSAGHHHTHPSTDIDDQQQGGYYDSGPLQRSNNDAFGNGKIGKLFRKVFPVYKDDDHHDHDHHENESENVSGGGGGGYHDIIAVTGHPSSRRILSTHPASSGNGNGNGGGAGLNRRRQSFLD
ncbi:hypothetical protein MJO29_010786 [Puccinia striiformis f. sp. tritici]|nr:hypothetical protein MJO29_010786 [Puccinia striiformis f. sp. tritici]